MKLWLLKNWTRGERKIIISSSRKDWSQLTLWRIFHQSYTKIARRNIANMLDQIGILKNIQGFFTFNHKFVVNKNAMSFLKSTVHNGSLTETEFYT